MATTFPSDLPPATSASQLTTYAMCPRKYAMRYVLHVEPEHRSTNLVLGSIVHSAIGFFFEEKHEGREVTPVTLDRILRADLSSETAEKRIRWKDETPASLLVRAKRLVSLYLDEFGSEQVLASEVPFEVELEDPETGEVRGRPLKGYFDFTVEPAPCELAGDAVVELKTSARGWREDDLTRHIQVGSYAFAHMKKCGGMSDLHIRVLLKLKREPRIETYRIQRGEPAIRWFLRAAWAIEDAILAGHFPPAPSPLCAECEYVSTCAAWVDDTPPAAIVAAPRSAPRETTVSAGGELGVT